MVLGEHAEENVRKYEREVCYKTNNDCDKHLQNDLHKLVKWSEKWQMFFSFGKCKCLHTLHRNVDVN